MGVLKVRDAAGNWVPIGVAGSAQLVFAKVLPPADLGGSGAGVWTQLPTSVVTNIPVMAGHTWRMTWNGMISKDGTAGVVHLSIMNDAGSFEFAHRSVQMAANTAAHFTVVYVGAAPASVVGRSCVFKSDTGQAWILGATAGAAYQGSFTLETFSSVMM